MFRQRQDKVLKDQSIHAEVRFDKACSEKVTYDVRRTTMRGR
jgi:hypothetical protein